ncbi:type III pantothenate kinase [Aliidiomarina sanyensis]|uniref:type III pantothenate kinase n=1 Tax=Aliidiomarina sanyensis TaxID=1249555 RepID=UPI00130046E1|nr:type III pantothenate kinase [Aliidiomarina sanyensis]
MSENLVLEFGNTRWKLGSVDREYQVTLVGSGHDLAQLTDLILHVAPTFVGVASVAPPQTVLDLRHALADSGVELLEASPEQGFGITLCYVDPSRLGVDRWLTLLAARYHGANQAAQSHAIIDAGTAVTLDVLNANGHHRGGWIAPGFRLMQESLIQKSTRLRVSDNVPDAILGEGTEAAIHLGCQASLQGFAHTAIQSAEEALGSPPDCLWFTGGDSGLINKKALQIAAKTQVIERPNLVLEGLAQWLSFKSPPRSF